jgi:hypothetical protein
LQAKDGNTRGRKVTFVLRARETMCDSVHFLNGLLGDVYYSTAALPPSFTEKPDWITCTHLTNFFTSRHMHTCSRFPRW